jgi:hypothetical protein
MIVYSYDSNAIITEPLSSHTENELLRAYTSIHTKLTERGLKPTLQRLDNEASGKLKQFMTNNGVSYQLVPPHIHRRNLAERAIVAHGKTTSSPVSAVSIHSFQCICGVASSTKPPQP